MNGSMKNSEALYIISHTATNSGGSGSLLSLGFQGSRRPRASSLYRLPFRFCKGLGFKVSGIRFRFLFKFSEGPFRGPPKGSAATAATTTTTTSPATVAVVVANTTCYAWSMLKRPSNPEDSGSKIDALTVHHAKPKGSSNTLGAQISTKY